jgi:hypothetical protein
VPSAASSSVDPLYQKKWSSSTRGRRNYPPAVARAVRSGCSCACAFVSRSLPLVGYSIALTSTCAFCVTQGHSHINMCFLCHTGPFSHQHVLPVSHRVGSHIDMCFLCHIGPFSHQHQHVLPVSHRAGSHIDMCFLCHIGSFSHQHACASCVTQGRISHRHVLPMSHRAGRISHILCPRPSGLASPARPAHPPPIPPRCLQPGRPCENRPGGIISSGRCGDVTRGAGPGSKPIGEGRSLVCQRLWNPNQKLLVCQNTRSQEATPAPQISARACRVVLTSSSF